MRGSYPGTNAVLWAAAAVPHPELGRYGEYVVGGEMEWTFVG